MLDGSPCFPLTSSFPSSFWCRQASPLVFVVPSQLHRSALFVTTASFAVKMNLSTSCLGIGVSTATISDRNFKPVGKTFRLDVISQLIQNRPTIVFRGSPTSKPVPGSFFSAVEGAVSSCRTLRLKSRMDNVNKEEILVEFQSGWKTGSSIKSHYSSFTSGTVPQSGLYTNSGGHSF